LIQQECNLGEKETQIDQKMIVLPVYSPKPFAFSTELANYLSLTHKTSEVTTVIESARKLMNEISAILTKGVKSTATNPVQKILDILAQNPAYILLIFIILAMILIGLPMLKLLLLGSKEISTFMVTMEEFP